MAADTLPRRTLGEQLDFVLSSFESLGLPPNPSSRWGRMRRLFFDKDGLPRGTITPADPAHDSAVEAQRDLNQVAFIFDVIPETELANQVEKLQLVLNDPVLPQDAERASTGRDTQSELFAAAICWNAGLLPVTLDEPDVRCICSGVIFGVAVKRLKKNIDRLRERIKDGATQIERSKLPGIIVLDTSFVLNPGNKRIWQPFDEAEFGCLYRQEIKRFIDKRHDDWQRWVRGKGVRGIIIIDSRIRLTPDGGWEHSGMTYSVPTVRFNQRRRREYDELWSALEGGIPHLVN